MNYEFTQDEADRHNALTKRGWEIVNGSLFIHEANLQGTPGWLTRKRLKKAITCFEQALEINPVGWQSMWALGKIHQRIGDHEASLHWFGRAYQINPSQPDVAREAGLAALDCGESKLALQFCLAAVKNKPEDPGLVCNLSLAHLLAGDDEAAVKCASDAVSRAPEDEISRTVLKFIESVAAGKYPRPKTIQEVFPN
jgi:tetratricopeptide (TPR) repeat protein